MPIMRMDERGNGYPFHAGDADGHEQRLSQGRSSIVHGGIGHFHPEESSGEGLILIDGLKSALAHFRLIWGVGGDEFSSIDQGG